MKKEELTSGNDLDCKVNLDEVILQMERDWDPAASGRWHCLTVARRPDRMWRVRIAFNTLCLHEEPRTDEEVVDCPQDIESVFLAYEPTEHVDRQHLHPRHDNDRHRFLNRLTSNYDHLVERAMVTIGQYVAEHPTEQACIDEPGRRGLWAGWLQKLGIGSSGDNE